MAVLSVDLEALSRASRAIGRLVCAQDPTHSAWLGHPPAALCSRCSGLHLALAATAAALAAAGAWRTAARGWSRLALAGASLLAPMALDVGLITLGVRAGDATTRVVTGVLGGAGATLLLLAATRVAVPGSGRASRPGVLVAAPAAAALLVLALLLRPPVALAPVLDVLGAAAVIANFSVLATTAVRAARGRVSHGDETLGVVLGLVGLMVLIWVRP